VGQNASHPDQIRTQCHPKRSGPIGYYSPPLERSFVVDAAGFCLFVDLENAAKCCQQNGNHTKYFRHVFRDFSLIATD